jgi:hypothetical protein
MSFNYSYLSITAVHAIGVDSLGSVAARPFIAHLSIAMAARASGGSAVFADWVSATAVEMFVLLAASSKLRESAFARPGLMKVKPMTTNTIPTLRIIEASTVIEPFTTPM